MSTTLKEGREGTMAESSSHSLVQKILETINVINTIGDFKTHKKECSTLTRRVNMLVPLFEEIRDDENLIMHMSKEGLRCINALEAALHTAKVLLHLCSKGSKLYLIFEQQKVAKQFQLLNTMFAQALVDQSTSLGISDEVREQVDLVHLQFQRSKGLEDPSDAELNTELTSVLNETHPRSMDQLERLAKLLKFDTARALMRELQALHWMRVEKEPAMLGILVEERTFEQLLGLVNDMRVLFPQEDLEQDDPELKKLQVVERAGVERAGGERGSAQAEGEKGIPNVPEDYKCPISLELMRDPVIIATGQTYERSCIQKWLDSGKRTCPKTGLSLPHTNVTPNHVLRSVIGEWCALHNVALSTRAPPPQQCSPEDKAAIDELVGQLGDPCPEVQRGAAGQIRLRAKKNVDHRICIAEQGAIPLLVGLLRAEDAKTQEHAVTALLNLSINDGNKGRIVAAGAIERIVEVLLNSSMEARENAAAALFSLSLVDENKVTIGSSGAIPALVALLHDGTPRGKKDAATAIFNLSIYQGNKARAVQAGVVPLLMKLLEDQPATMVDEALAILGILATHAEGRLAIAAVGPTEVWLKIIGSESPRNKENSAAILLALCSHDQEYAKLTKESNAVEVLTGLARARDSTNRAKRKAMALLELLKKIQRSPSPQPCMATSVTLQEQLHR